MAVCSRPHGQEGQADKACYKHIGAASQAQNVALMVDDSHLDICWRDNTAGHQKSKSYNVLMIASSSKWYRNQKEKVLCPTKAHGK